MVAPLAPFPFAGAIWYQGESNVGRAEQYARLFPAMIEDWRIGSLVLPPVGSTEPEGTSTRCGPPPKLPTHGFPGVALASTSVTFLWRSPLPSAVGVSRRNGGSSSGAE